MRRGGKWEETSCESKKNEVIIQPYKPTQAHYSAYFGECFNVYVVFLCTVASKG